MDRSALCSACTKLGIDLSVAQLDAFEAHEEALYEANARMNLTRVNRQECWLRHFVDSLLIAEFIPRGSAVLDIGSGPGLPAWPLACARQDVHVTALDSNGKMVGFLLTRPLPNLTVLQGRAEDNPPREQFDVVTGRALAPLPIQLELSAAPCRTGGVVLPMRTPRDQPFPIPTPGLGLTLEGVFERQLPGTDVTRLFPVFRKRSGTAPKFPRSWGEIRRANPISRAP